MKNEKACYQCKHRGTVPGDTHSMCAFNWATSENLPPQGNSHGIKNGWWIFPFNYDPTWMIGECIAFDDGTHKVKEVPSHLKKYPMTEEELFPRTRQTGKIEAMIQSMVHHFKKNEHIGLAGCKDPVRILKRLSELGVEAKAEPMSCWREESGEQIYTGYLFKQKKL